MAQGVAGAGLALAVGCSAAGDITELSVDPPPRSGAQLIPIPPPAPEPVAPPPAPVAAVAVVDPAPAAPEDLRDEAAGRRKREARQRAAQQATYVHYAIYCGRG